MVKKFVLLGIATVVLGLAGFGTYSIFDDGGNAEANSPIECSKASDDTTDPPTLTITCSGSFDYQTPAGPQTLTFDIVVVATDNPPAGPSFGDTIQSCALALGGGPPAPISNGPCP